MAILAVNGCQVKERIADNAQGQHPETKIYTAIIEDSTSGSTKTSLDENGNVLWKSGDRVSIFEGSTVNEQYQVSEESDGKTSSILNKISPSGFVAGGEIEHNIAFYPYSASSTIARDGSSYVIRDIALPATQTYAEGSFGNGAFPMAAVTSSTTDYTLKFKNVLGGLKLQLKGTATIASIKVTGNRSETLCGDAEVTVSSGSIPAISLTDDSAKTVTLDCGDGVALNAENATPFIIALPPITMTGGFTVLITDTDGNQMEVSTSKTQSINRSNLLRMPEVNYVGTAVEFPLSEKHEYTITMEGSETRTMLSSDNRLVWKAGDKVLLSNGAVSAICTIPDIYDGCTTAVVETDLTLSGNVCCIYPGDAVIQEGASFYVDIPEDQGDDGSAYMVCSGSSTGNSITLSPRTALFRFTMTSAVEDLSFVRLSFEGDPVAGRLQIDENGASVVSGTSSVKVAARDDQVYYFSVLPGTITKMNADVCKTDGSFGRKTAPISRTISAGTLFSISLNPSTLSFDIVDLGLSVYWAKSNLSENGLCANPEDYGDYYAWGETAPKDNYNWTTYIWCNGSLNTLTKYCIEDAYGTVDGKTELESSDDVAREHLGASWRIPADMEWTELRENCTWTWGKLNGIDGQLATSKINGCSLFFPAAGRRVNTSFRDVGNFGYYWSSTLDSYSPNAWNVNLYKGDVFRYNYYRTDGMTIRPVFSK